MTYEELIKLGAKPGAPSDAGLLEPGNIDVMHRPRVKNADGSFSTVRSMSFEDDGREILVPTVSEDGRVLSDDDAVAAYRKTGKHLGKFDNPDNATAFAKRLHEQQERDLVPDPGNPGRAIPRPPSSGGGLTLEQLQALGAKPGPDDAAGAPPSAGPVPLPKPEPTKGEAFLRSFANGASFGFGPAFQGAVETGLSKIPGVRNAYASVTGNESVKNPDLTYSERRRQYSDPLDAAREAHPYVSMGGDLLGATATSLAAPEIKALGAMTPAVRAATEGAAYGFAQGTGEAVSHGKNLEDTLAEARKGAVTGGAMGGVMGKLGGNLVEGAPKAAKDWVVKDIVGETKGASTPTARKNLARDAEDVGNLLREDKELDRAVDHARHGDKDALTAAQATIKAKLAKVSEPRSDLYAEADSALPDGGVRAGDVIKSLKESIADRVKTGRGHEGAEARELQKIVDRLEAAGDWGMEESVKLSPKTEADVQTLSAVRSNVRDPAKLAEIDQQIASLKATGKPVATHNPDKIVPLEQLRDLVTDAQNTAFQVEGGINGTAAFRKAKEVANVVRDVLDEHLDRAAAVTPETVEAIKEMNWRISALKNIENVVEQRVNRATQDATGAGMGGTFGAAMRKLSHTNPLVGAGMGLAATGMGVHVPGLHPGIAGALLPIAAKGTIAGKRLLDRGVANLIDQAGGATAARANLAGYRVLDRIIQSAKSGPVRASLILEAIQSGIPREMALWAAKSADHGLLNDAGQDAADAVQQAVGQ